MAKSKAPKANGDVKLYEKLYRDMLLIRRFEEESARAYSQGKIGGFLHLYIGQEAIAVGTVAVLHDDDYVTTSYRDHGLALTRGVSARACMAELFGKDTGCSRGLGGSMHMFDVSKNFLGGHAIVGGHCALAAGAAFKCKYLDEERVSVVFFGEGATNIGGFHEAMTLAALWKLPCIFICENNEYAMGTSAQRSSPVTEYAKKAISYGMPGTRIEGHDVRVVMKTVDEAAQHARDGKGPVFIEILTYRFRGHSMSDPGKYRTAAEVEERKKTKDPVLFTQKLLLDLGLKESRIKEIAEHVESEVIDAITFSENSPEPDESLLFSTVLA